MQLAKLNLTKFCHTKKYESSATFLSKLAKSFRIIVVLEIRIIQSASCMYIYLHICLHQVRGWPNVCV